MKELNLDLFVLSETNKNWDETAKYILSKLMRRDGPGAAITASDYLIKEGYIPGGTALLFKGQHSGRILSRASDKWGRFCYALLGRKDETVVPILVLYRVCQKRGSVTSPNTSYACEVNHLRLKGCKYPDPRAQLFHDVGKLLYEWNNLGYLPIITGDFNSVTCDGDLREFMSKHGLFDLVSDPNQGPPPRIYTNGKTRLDFILLR